jgi:hypothetical protein
LRVVALDERLVLEETELPARYEACGGRRGVSGFVESGRPARVRVQHGAGRGCWKKARLDRAIRRAARAIAHLRIASMHGTPAFEPGQ